MAAPERWMVSNPSADVNRPEDDDESEGKWTQSSGLSRDRITTIVADQLETFHMVVGQGSVFYNVGSNFASLGVTYWPGLGAHSTQGYIERLRRYSLTFAGDVMSTTTLMEESSPTAAILDEPLLDAVARATYEQKAEIWRILGVVDHIARRVVHPNPQPVSSDWLDDALSARARPTPISLEDWYTDETA